MVSLIGGIVILVAALAHYAIKLRIAYWVAREPENAGGVPTLDAVVFPPAFAAFGLWLASGAASGAPSAWAYVGLWLVLILAALGGAAAASRLGARRRRPPLGS